MDKTDVFLIQLLLANSRLPYAELAKKLNLSVNAIHKRIQSLVEAGVIRRFTAKVSHFAVNSVQVFSYGNSQIGNIHGLADKLKTHGSVYWLAVGGGNFLYIGAYLREVYELAALVAYIKEEAKMPEPTVGIMAAPPVLPAFDPNDRALYALDYQIIRALKDDSRKPISEVADELGISAKTARRRLNRMIKNGLIELSVEWYPDASNDIVTLVQLYLKPDADPASAFKIVKKYAPHMLFYWQFVDIPNVATYAVWTSTMKELQGIRESLEKEEDVLSVVPNVLYVGYIFSTWRDQLVEQ